MSAAKKPKFDMNKPRRPNYHAQKSRKAFLMPGQRGFLATCNFQEKDCTRECYSILNQYADEMYPHTDTRNKPETSPNESKTVCKDDDSSDEDITTQLQKDIEATKVDKKNKQLRFQAVDTGASNCLFISTSLPDPVELGVRIARDIASAKQQKSRFLLRLIPIEIVCRANLVDIVNSAGILFDKYFLKEPKSFSIVFNRRFNNSIGRDDAIKELADLITMKNAGNKVDLKGAELSVILEIIKGLCCISVVPDYLKLKKYNLFELGSPPAAQNQAKEALAKTSTADQAESKDAPVEELATEAAAVAETCDE